MLPMLAGSGTGSALGGVINGNRNRLFETLLGAAVLTIVGCAAESTLSSREEYEPKALGLQVFIGFGFGLAATASTMVGNIESSMREHGELKLFCSYISLGCWSANKRHVVIATAQGIIAQVRILGGSIGIAASSAVLGVKTNSELAKVLSPEQLAHLASAMSNLAPAQKEAVRQAYTEALRQDMIICCAVMGLGLIFTLGVYSRTRLSIPEAGKKHFLEEIERKRTEEGVRIHDSSTD